MTIKTRRPTLAVTSSAIALALTLAGCGGNLESNAASNASESAFPDGPVTLTIGQDPGGSTDLIGRALADVAAGELDVAMPVVNKPGANGAVAAKELATKPADGQNLMVVNASLISITPLAAPENKVDIDDYEVVTGISQDDFVLVTNPATGFETVADLKAAGKPLKFATTGVGTGSQLSQELLFKQAEIPGTAVPFDGGAPSLTAVLGKQVDVASIQLGEAFPQIQAGKLTPLVVFSKERNSFLPDVPTAIEAGYDVPVSQYRAVIAPKGTPEETITELREAFQAAFQDADYQAFNKKGLLTPFEKDGEQVKQEFTQSLETYTALTTKYGITLGEQ